MKSPKLKPVAKLIKATCIISLCLACNACIGKVVGAAVDTTIEVAKVPFKVAGAVVDVATGDDKKKRKDKRQSKSVDDE